VWQQPCGSQREVSEFTTIKTHPAVGCNDAGFCETLGAHTVDIGAARGCRAAKKVGMA